MRPSIYAKEVTTIRRAEGLNSKRAFERNMRLPKISLRKCFFLTLAFAFVLIFGIQIRERLFWKTKSAIFQAPHSNEGDIDRRNRFYTTSVEYDEKSNDRRIETGNKISLQETIQRETEQEIISSQKKRQQNVLYDQQNEENGLEEQQQLNNYERPELKSWYFHNGERYPVPMKFSNGESKQYYPKLFPHEDPQSDRIVNQLMFVPPDYETIQEEGHLKTILLFNGLGPWNIKQGRDVFISSKCPVDTCTITANRANPAAADLVLYKDHFIPTGVHRPSKQVYMLYYLECPYHTQHVKVPDAINWTATYRRDSDIVAPYEKWEYYDSKVKQMEQERNHALNKTRKVAWFVSNCGARNGRLQYAHELQKYIDVDIYGACGTFKCSRATADKCFDILDHEYKFYLAFENSNCKDYITEKFFVNALNRNILPIVMGARPEDYEISAPYRSYIHVDEFNSPKELAEYLHILDKNDDLYNSYFKWKGTGEFINTYFWCRVCATLHNENALKHPKWYPNVNEWWRGPGVCTNGSWRNFKARKDIIRDD